VADTNVLKVTVTQSRPKLSKRQVSSKESESKTRSVVAAPEFRIILSKAAFPCFYVFFTL